MKGGIGKTTSLEIRTPEGVVFSQPLASPVTRFLAYSIDFVIIVLMQRAFREGMQVLFVISEDIAVAVQIILFFVISIGYPILLEWFWSGQTVGKRVVGLRVIDEGGLGLRGTQIVVRNLMRAVDSLPVFYFVGGLASLLSKRSQRLGDLAAGTLVVRTPRSRTPRIQDLLGKMYYNCFREHPHLEARLRQRVSPEEGQMVMHALVRRDDFEPEERVRLFGELADYFREMVTFPAEDLTGMTDEQYLRNVADTVFRGRG